MSSPRWSAKDKANALSQLNEIGILLSTEHNHDRLLEIILEKAKEISNADNGALYILTDSNRLKFTIMHSTSLGIRVGGTTGKRIPFSPVKLHDRHGRPNHKRLVAHAAITKQSVNIENLYSTTTYDFSATKAFDRVNKYTSRSVLAIPMMNKKNRVLGILHLVNAQDKHGKIISFSKDVQYFVEALASQAAVAMENHRLIKEQEDLLNGIIKMLAFAIDKKSEHTSNHCQAIPVLMEMLADAACKQRTGYFKDFDLTTEERYELKVASWLHDCGKLTTPPHILEKATKLQTIFDRIELVRTRFEVVIRDLEIAHLKGTLSKQNFEKQKKQIQADWKFLKELNYGSEFTDDDKLKELERIGSRVWHHTVGKKIPQEYKFFTKDEYSNLSIRKGTLTSEERTVVNNHMAITIDMLESLPLPKHLRRVPEYAGGHHERMDGAGFPKGLKRHEMSLPARMMAVADIFEALTAVDRPYKKPKSLSETLKIMAHMKRTHHIDPDVFDLFLKEKIYLKYGRKFLLPDQLDIVDEKEIKRLAEIPAKAAEQDTPKPQSKTTKGK